MGHPPSWTDTPRIEIQDVWWGLGGWLRVVKGFRCFRAEELSSDRHPFPANSYACWFFVIPYDKSSQQIVTRKVKIPPFFPTDGKGLLTFWTDAVCRLFMS